MTFKAVSFLIVSILLFSFGSKNNAVPIRAEVVEERPRVIVATDGEIDDECSSVNFLGNVELEGEMDKITPGTGLRNMESPGWGGRYVRVRQNNWLDLVADPSYKYPEGRWWGNSAWGRERLRQNIPNDTMLLNYLKPMWRWAGAFQNDFAARADWCVKSYKEAKSRESS